MTTSADVFDPSTRFWFQFLSIRQWWKLKPMHSSITTLGKVTGLGVNNSHFFGRTFDVERGINGLN